jgi:serine/threonine protein kinase
MDHECEAFIPAPELAQLLAKLLAAEREALVLRYCHGQSLAEISSQLGRTPAAAVGLLRRGSRAMRTLVRGGEPPVGNEPADSHAQESRVDPVIVFYLEAEDQGQTPDRGEFLDLYSDLRAELETFFADHDGVGRLLKPGRVGGKGTDSPGQMVSRREAAAGAIPSTLSGERAGEHSILAMLDRVGDYVLLKQISWGGQGVVYMARQLTLNRIVALKMILNGPLALPINVQRFLFEAEAVANLDHPNIVPVYEVGQHLGHRFFSMKLIDGGNLDEQLPRYRNDPQAVARLMVTIARAMHYAHQRGIRHRDLKPSNILLDSAGQPHITDFGLAQRDGDPAKTAPGTILGTPAYMAPEQASGKGPVTTATDVYGLGATLYALVTGQPPFQAGSVQETLRQVQECNPKPPHAVKPAVDRDLETICLKCLEKIPQRRYGSADALADDLERWLRGEPTQARPGGLARQIWGWARRYPISAGWTALFVLLLLWLTLLVGSVPNLSASNSQESARLAKSLDIEIEILKRAVMVTARNPKLPALLKQYQGRKDKLQRAGLEQYLNSARSEFNHWFGLQGQPLVNLFILDANGTLLADSNLDSISIAMNYRRWDFWVRIPNESDPVYVSKVFVSYRDGKYRFAVITPIWDDDGREIGRLVATKPVNYPLVVLDLKDEAAGTALVSPMDWSYQGRATSFPAPKPNYIVVLDGDQSIRRLHPKWVAEDHLSKLNAFEADPNLQEEMAVWTGNACFTNYHRVGRTHFVVLIERPYPRMVFVIAFALMAILAGSSLVYLGRHAAIPRLRRLGQERAAPEHPVVDEGGHGDGAEAHSGPSTQG